MHMADTMPMSTLTLDGARRVLDAAIAHADSIGLAVCITVTDPAGEPIVSARMDGAPRLSAEIAANKAWTVTSFKGLPTNAWWGILEHEPALLHGITHTPRLTIFGGGVGVRVGGELVGAIGVSGGSAEEDTQIATAGARALG
jgi:uncharacterized protein GlcG (DUF336 family)